MEDHQEDPLEGKDHQVHLTPWPCASFYSATTSSNPRYNCIGKHFFDTVGQSMLQLARAQDQTNCYLQEHLQQGQINMQVHTGALQQLATSTYQRYFDHIFASIPIYDGSNREDFFPWLEHLEAACFYSGKEY